MSAAPLRQAWAQIYGTRAPNLSDELLRMGIAYRLQEKAIGALSRTASATLRSGDTRRTSAQMKPGTQLVRNWNGRTVSVTVTETGFGFEDRSYKSLSAIAREVTGTAWSGPRFFGLTEKAGG